MHSATYRKRLTTAVAGAALASALAVSGASANYASVGSPGAGDPPEVAPPPSSIAVSAAEEYQDLRSPETAAQAVADEPSEPTGFDPVSAAIGAVAAGGLSLVLMATLGMRRTARRRPASA
jgi:hypothetical protein